MQDLVGIVRMESEMQQALEKIDDAAGARREGRDHRQSSSTTPAGTRRSISTTCWRFPR